MRWHPPETVGEAWRTILLSLAGGSVLVASVGAGAWWLDRTSSEPPAELPSVLVATETPGDPTPGPTGSEPVPTPTPSALSPRVPAPPLEVRIPALELNAAVVPVALEGSALVPPDDVTLVGWWDGGAMPGEPRGTVLLTGHTWSQGDGVFDRLGEVEVGDRVRLSTRKGAATYRVVAVTSYSTHQLAEVAPRLFAAQVPSRLVLTTCTDFCDGVYLGTTVVVATPAG